MIITLSILGLLSFVYSSNTQLTSKASESCPTAQNSAIIDLKTTQIICSSNIDSEIEIGNVTKLLVIDILFDEINKGTMSLDQGYYVSNYVIYKNIKTYSEVYAYYKNSNATVNLKELITSILLFGADDSTIAVARHIANIYYGENLMYESSGNLEKDFVTMMNQRLKEYGINKELYNSTGLLGTNHNYITNSNYMLDDQINKLTIKETFILTKNILEKYGNNGTELNNNPYLNIINYTAIPDSEQDGFSNIDFNFYPGTDTVTGSIYSNNLSIYDPNYYVDNFMLDINQQGLIAGLSYSNVNSPTTNYTSTTLLGYYLDIVNGREFIIINNTSKEFSLYTYEGQSEEVKNETLKAVEVYITQKGLIEYVLTNLERTSFSKYLNYSDDFNIAVYRGKKDNIEVALKTDYELYLEKSDQVKINVNVQIKDEYDMTEYDGTSQVRSPINKGDEVATVEISIDNNRIELIDNSIFEFVLIAQEDVSKDNILVLLYYKIGDFIQFSIDYFFEVLL